MCVQSDGLQKTTKKNNNTHLKQLAVLKATKTPEIVKGFSFLSKTLDVFVAPC